MGLILTRTQDWIEQNPNMDKNMARPRNFGAFDFFVSQAGAPNGLLDADLRRRALASIGNTIKIPVIDYNGDVTVSNSRTCVIPVNDNTSRMVGVTFATYTVGFRMIPQLHLNNYISYQRDYARKFYNIMMALGNKLDRDAITALNTNKSQQYADKLIYDVAANAFQIPWDYREEILGDLHPIFKANDYLGQIHVIGNTGLDSMISKLAEHGAYNDVNKALEYQGKTYHFTNNLTNEAGKFATFFAVEDGNVSILTRVDREALAGTKMANDEFEVVTLPGLGIPVGTHYHTELGNVAELYPQDESVQDMTCNQIEYFGFSVDVAFVVAYNSAPETIANPILRVEIARKDGNAVARPVEIVNTAENPVYTQVAG